MVIAEYKYLTPEQRRFVERWKAYRETQKQRSAVWQALKSKDTRTARKIAMQAVRDNSFSLNNWRLMYSALRSAAPNGNP